jgi:hypothetical protein
MNDLFSLKLDVTRLPVVKEIELDGNKYEAHFLPLMQSEFSALQKSVNSDAQLIHLSWVHPNGEKRTTSPEQADEFPPLAFAAIVKAALEVSGFGKKAATDAKKD